MIKCAKQADKYYPNLDRKFIDAVGYGSTGHTRQIENKKHGHFVIIFIEKKATTLEIFHESLHAAMFMLSMAGIVISVDNHEILAYLQGYIADEIIKKLKEGK
jgi:hypothetical protein